MQNYFSFFSILARFLPCLASSLLFCRSRSICVSQNLTWYQSTGICNQCTSNFICRFRRLKKQQRMESKLEFPQSAILTPYNYFEWKPKIQLHLRSRGLFRITMGTEVEPTSQWRKQDISVAWTRPSASYVYLFLRNCYFMLNHVQLQMKNGKFWKNCLENRMKCKVTFSKMS